MNSKKTLEDYEKIRNKLKSVRDSVSKDLTQIIFNKVGKFPEGLTKIGWRQYTPYHNDGDPCEFSVNACPEWMYVEYNGNETYCSEELLDYHQIEPFLKKVCKILNKIDDDLFLAAYDDHVIVIIDDQGNESIKDCNHD